MGLSRGPFTTRVFIMEPGLIYSVYVLYRATGVKRNDIIDIFIEELDKEHKDLFLPKEDFEIGLVSTAILFFFAGFDTTSTTLGVVVFGLIHHPEVQEKLRQEIEDVIGDDEKITAEHLRDLKYTENVINESMRRYFQIGQLLLHLAQPTQ